MNLLLFILLNAFLLTFTAMYLYENSEIKKDVSKDVNYFSSILTHLFWIAIMISIVIIFIVWAILKVGILW